MIYVTFCSRKGVSGHVNDEVFADELKAQMEQSEVYGIQADGDELAVCCDILGRRLPSKRVYTFLGDNAKEIAQNW
jgi:hypothetical protein